MLFFCIHAEYFFFQITGCFALTFLDDMWFKFTISIPGNSQFYFAHAGYNRFLHVPISAICCFFVLVIIFCIPIFCIWTANISFIISSNSLHFLGWYILIIRKAHVHFSGSTFSRAIYLCWLCFIFYANFRFTQFTGQVLSYITNCLIIFSDTRESEQKISDAKKEIKSFWTFFPYIMDKSFSNIALIDD